MARGCSDCSNRALIAPMKIAESLWTRRIGRSSANQRSPSGWPADGPRDVSGPATRSAIAAPAHRRNRSVAPCPLISLLSTPQRPPECESPHTSPVATWPGTDPVRLSPCRSVCSRPDRPGSRRPQAGLPDGGQVIVGLRRVQGGEPPARPRRYMNGTGAASRGGRRGGSRGTAASVCGP